MLNVLQKTKGEFINAKKNLKVRLFTKKIKRQLRQKKKKEEEEGKNIKQINNCQHTLCPTTCQMSCSIAGVQYRPVGKAQKVNLAHI